MIELTQSEIIAIAGGGKSKATDVWNGIKWVSGELAKSVAVQMATDYIYSNYSSLRNSISNGFDSFSNAYAKNYAYKGYC